MLRSARLRRALVARCAHSSRGCPAPPRAPRAPPAARRGLRARWPLLAVGFGRVSPRTRSARTVGPTCPACSSRRAVQCKKPPKFALSVCAPAFAGRTVCLARVVSPAATCPATPTKAGFPSFRSGLLRRAPRLLPRGARVVARARASPALSSLVSPVSTAGAAFGGRGGLAPLACRLCRSSRSARRSVVGLCAPRRRTSFLRALRGRAWGSSARRVPLLRAVAPARSLLVALRARFAPQTPLAGGFCPLCGRCVARLALRAVALSFCCPLVFFLLVACADPPRVLAPVSPPCVSCSRAIAPRLRCSPRCAITRWPLRAPLWSRCMGYNNRSSAAPLSRYLRRMLLKTLGGTAPLLEKFLLGSGKRKKRTKRKKI